MSDGLFDRERWVEHCRGWRVHDCAIMDATRTFYVLREECEGCHELPRTRLLFARAERPLDQKRFVHSEVGHFGFTELAYGPGSVEFVAVDTARRTFCYDRERAALEADVPGGIAGTELCATVRRMTRVGSTLFAVGWPRRVWRRRGPDDWGLLDAGLPLPPGLADEADPGYLDALTGFAFHDLAGPAESDLWAVGDGGEVWRHDGARWTRCPFPTAEGLCTVAWGEGRVWVTTRSGGVWVGGAGRWELLVERSPFAPFLDSVWFAGQLWCGSEAGVWRLAGRELVPGAPSPEVSRVAGRLDVSPDGRHLLAASAYGAALFDGVAWRVLWSGLEME